MADLITKPDIALASRIVRYDALVPCLDAFIDTRTPGSDKKENFTIIGPGVSENPNQHVHIAEPHGFNIGGARQPPGCTNSQHSHDTAEVFYVHAGTWRFDLGEHGDEASAELGPGDIISIPTQVFRGFTNIGSETGFLWAVLGGDDPGRVLWAPKVFDMAAEYGLILMDDGLLIDTTKGESVPAGKARMPVTSRAQVAALKTLTNDQLDACIARQGTNMPEGPFSALPGARERILIGSGQIDWPHGFVISEVKLTAGADIPAHRLDIADVWFVQSGHVRITIGAETSTLSAGDTVTIPCNTARSLQNVGDSAATLITVRGGDKLADIDWS